MLTRPRARNFLHRLLLLACAACAFACPDDDDDWGHDYRPVVAELPPGVATMSARIAARVPEGRWLFAIDARGVFDLRSVVPAPLVATHADVHFCGGAPCPGEFFTLECTQGFCSFLFEISVERSSTSDVALSAGFRFEGPQEEGLGGWGCGTRTSPDYVPEEERARLFEVIITPFDVVVAPDAGAPLGDAGIRRDAAADAAPFGASMDARVFDAELPKSDAAAPVAPRFGELVDARDGRVYPLVQLGAKWWMAKNLNFGEMRRSASGGPEDDARVQKLCANDDLNQCEALGGLYSWAEAHGLAATCNDVSCSAMLTPPHRGICPEGFHLPSADDWRQLASYLAPSASIPDVGSAPWRSLAPAIKSTRGWPADSIGTNTSGLDVLAAGFWGEGLFFELNEVARIAAFGEHTANNATGLVVRRDSAEFAAYVKAAAVSVRCVR